jgi:hypothetical protein
VDVVVTRRDLMRMAQPALATAAMASALRADTVDAARPAPEPPPAALDAIGYLPSTATDDRAVISAWLLAPDPELHDRRSASVTVSAHGTDDLEGHDRIALVLYQHIRLPDDREIVWSPWQYTGGSECPRAASADCSYVTGLSCGRSRVSLTQASGSRAAGTERVRGRRWDFSADGGARCVALRDGVYLIPLLGDDCASVSWSRMRYARGQLREGSGAGRPIPHLALRVESVRS